MKTLYRFNCYCGRSGTLTGIFVADSKDVMDLIKYKIEVYFGEVLGKHSEIYGTIEEGDIAAITENKEVIDIFEQYNLDSGHNPFDCFVVQSSIPEEMKVEEAMVMEVIEYYRSKEVV